MQTGTQIQMQNRGKDMATLMQKDALIEYVVSALALMCREEHAHQQPGHPEALLPEEKELCQLRAWLYKTDHEAINRQAVIDQVKPIFDRYQQLNQTQAG